MKVLILVLSITDDDFIDDVIGDVIDDVVWSRNVIQEPSLYTTLAGIFARRRWTSAVVTGLKLFSDGPPYGLMPCSNAAKTRNR